MWPFSRPIPRGFYPEADIIEYVRESNNFDPYELTGGASALMIYESGPERTWLVATRLRLYSITDDINKREPRINWSISRSRIFPGGGFNLDIITRSLDRERGLVDIGYRKGNPYTTDLFPSDNFAERLRAMIYKKMMN